MTVLFTPADTRKTIETVNTAAQVLAENMNDAGLSGSEFAREYVQWIIRFRKFANENNSTIQHAKNSVYDAAQEYAAQLKDYSARFQELTKRKVEVPKPLPRKPLKKAMQEAVKDATEIVITPAVTVASKLGVFLAVGAGVGILFLAMRQKA